jgi:PAS domain S-box-containing protein
MWAGVSTPLIPSRRSLALVTVSVVVITAVVLPVSRHQFGPSVSFVPSLISVVACFDVVSMCLLVGEYRDRGDPRLLAMAWAYSWSLVMMGGYALAFPGAVLAHPPLALAPSMAPYLYVAWHAGFPFLLGAAWAPWPARWTTATPARQRDAVAMVTVAGAVLSGVAAVALFAVSIHRLPVLISGLDTTGMTAVTAPLAVPAVLIALAAAAHGTRHRTGPERWSVVAVLVCLCDLVLTYFSGTRYSLGWYCGRSMTLAATAVVLIAMLAEFRRMKARAEHDAARLRFLGEIVDNARDAIYSVNRARVITSWNAAAASLYGYSAAEAVGKPLAMLVPPERRTELDQWFACIEQGGRVDQAETVRQRRDGSLVEVSLTVSPVLDVSGRVSGSSITARDITERRQAEAQLRRQAIVFDRMTDLVIITDTHGGILDCNPAAERILGYSRQQLSGRVPDLTGDQASADECFTAATDHLVHHNAWTGDLRAVHADGGTTVVESVIVPMRDTGDAVAGLIVVGRDVTDSRAAAAALVAAERRFTQAFTHAPIGVLLTGLEADNDGRFLSANPAACAMLGYSRAQLLDLRVTDITHPDDQTDSQAQHRRLLRKDESILHLDTRYVRADGGMIWASVSVSLVRDQAERPLYTITHIEDITQKRADRDRLALANTELAAANQALQRVNDELDRFTATVAHDLKNPIASIAAYADVLKELFDAPRDAEACDALGAILRNTHRMGTLIDDLLAYARASNEPLTLDTVDTLALVRDIAAELAPILERTGARLTIGQLPVIAAHSVQLRQVFTNVITNAVKYVAPGVAPDIRIDATPLDGGWSFAIADNGIGIPAAARHRVFRMFHRETSNGYEGTGIGLTTCKRIIDRHGGTMWVDSRPPAANAHHTTGSVFHFTLPAGADQTRPVLSLR